MEGGEGPGGSILLAIVAAANRWSTDGESGKETWITVPYLQRERGREREREEGGLYNCFPHKNRKYLADAGKLNLANSVFLVGAYLILMLGWKSENPIEHFAWPESSRCESIGTRHTLNLISGFPLSTASGVWKGEEYLAGWIARRSTLRMSGSRTGRRYSHYDSPLNSYLHELVPGKFVAFK